ncbi:MAG: mycofactocin biosynthesis chaperone MftB [Acidimicrobiaceae bacterium]|nr:mycofactocin biosynthesis chaperone MftB [Acidimicrobiaceae bacterium]
MPGDGGDTSRPLRLNAKVSLRDEAFGALAYHHDTRRLVFLKSRPLVELVRRLEEYGSGFEAINALVRPEEHAIYARALESLSRSEIVCGR